MTQSKRGRPKGSPNRTTHEAKQALLMVFEKLGGVNRLVKWVNKNDANSVTSRSADRTQATVAELIPLNLLEAEVTQLFEADAS